MPVNNNVIVCFDLETGSICTRTCEVVEVACVAIHPHSLTVIPGSEFVSLMRPLDMNNLQDEALRVNKKTREELEKAPERGAVWKLFAAHIKRFNKKGGLFGRPIAAGKNIRNFDLPIVERLCKAHGPSDKDGRNGLFHPRTVLDLEDVIFQWFEGSDELPNYKMDSLREYFGLTSEGAHSAAVDVQQTADLICRFLKLHRSLAKKVSFKGGLV